MALWRCLALWTVVTALMAAAGVVLLPLVVGRTTDLPGLVAKVAAAALLGSGAWLWLLTTAVIDETVRGGRRGRILVPASLRRVVLVLCGASLASGLAPAVAASTGSPTGLSHSGRSVVIAVPTDEHAAHPTVRRPPRVVVVRRGDSLWQLAAERVAEYDAEYATQRETAVTAGWHALYRRNRAVIGDDPDLIRPGQRLSLPDQLTQGDDR